MRILARGDASALTSPQTAAAACSSGRAAPESFGGLLGGLPFAAIGAALGAVGGGSGGGWSDAAALTEPRTKTQFAGELEYCAGSKGCPVVTGTGARTKRVAGIKNLDVYALALYVDPAAARAALAPKFRGAAAPAALAGEQALFDELINAEGVEKTLRIVITSKLVKRGAFLDALEDRLEPPLRQAGQLAALRDFTRQFDETHFHKGLEVTFTAKGATLATALDGKQVGTISNKQLTHALLGIYLGCDPASQPAKDSFGAGLAAMVLS